MGVEIERKFLVVGNGWKTTGVRMVQGYLCREPGRTVRVRVAGAQAFLTIKGPSQGSTRAEFEYPIPVPEAQELLRLCEGPLVEKDRHEVPFAGHLWEVDEFYGANEGLITAEIELQHEDEAFETPPWVGVEVTRDRRYANSQLSVQPFQTWRKE